MTLRADAGDSELALIVNETAPLVPPGVDTVTVRVPEPEICSVAATDVELVTLTPLTITPDPLILTVVAPTTKFVPVKVA